MNILINASNLSPAGGAAQVADSICKELYKYPQHHFVVILPKTFDKTREVIEGYSNINAITYSYPLKDWKSLLTSRNEFLDTLVAKESVDRVLTVFGPIKWVPKCKHLCGFALPHIPLSDSVFFSRMPFIRRLKAKLFIAYMTYLFKRCSEVFYTENPLITELVKKKLHTQEVYTVTNNYNQIFDNPDKWIQHHLSPFDGVRLFSASSMMEHKNLGIAIDVARNLINNYPGFRFQFVLTVEEKNYFPIPSDLRGHFYFTGPVHITEIPSLYSQCDVVFQPSLLECFSVSYPEAMIMKKPLVVPDLEFAKGLCNEAAQYYDPVSVESCTQAIYKVANDKLLQAKLIDNGLLQLENYDSYIERACKLIKLCEGL
ncbi:glycosyltransferase family 4 protein [Bacteroides sp.]